MKRHNHAWIMVIGCLIPLLLLIALPYFGITGNWLWFVAITVMIMAHLYMMKGHGHKNHGGE